MSRYPAKLDILSKDEFVLTRQPHPRHSVQVRHAAVWTLCQHTSVRVHACTDEESALHDEFPGNRVSRLISHKPKGLTVCFLHLASVLFWSRAG